MSLIRGTLVLTLVIAVAAAAKGAEQTTWYQLVLEDAMFTSDDPKQVREIVLDLEQVGERWGAIYGLSRNYNMATHNGAVSEATVAGDTLTIRLTTDITPDKWIPAAQGSYAVTLARGADGVLTGSFAGTFKGKPVKGPARGRAYAPTPAADHVPLKPLEHPRLLLRAAELPALRAKAKTPFGAAALKRLEAHGTPSALGLLYQLSGDQAWASKAQAEAELYLKGEKPPGDPFVPKRPYWHQLEELALVYDLCFDALSEDFKARYRAWAADLCFKTFFAPESLGTTNWHVVSNHVANMYSGLALSGLALFDQPAPAPQEPTPPFTDEALPPAAGFAPADGVPVVAMTPGRSPTEWLLTEPLKQAAPEDPRAQFYGLEKVHPVVGTKVKVGEFGLTFAAITPDLKSEADFGGVKIGQWLPGAAGKASKDPLTLVMYTVLDVKQPGLYKVENPVSRANLAQLALNGKLLANGQVVRLDKGLYPLMQMIQFRIRWGEVAPRLSPATDEDVKAWQVKVTELRQQHETRVQSHASTLATWKRSGGGDPSFQRMLRLGRFAMTLHAQDAVGKGGFQGEVGGYSVDATSGAAKFWPAYRRALGFDLTPDRELPDYIPRKLVGGQQDINGTAHIGGEFFAALFPTIRPDWQGEVLGAWLREAKAGEDPAAVLAHDPVRAFLSFPLDLKPAPLGTRLPLSWQAPGLGYYALRSGWGADAFVFQLFNKQQAIIGWNGANAGTFRLRGLGVDWAGGTTDRVRRREQENVVILPQAELEDGARGRLAHLAVDGQTLVASVDLDEVYEARGRWQLSKYGHVRRPAFPKPGEELDPPSGISALRAIAVDYSGLSGAPCLLVAVDRIQGGGGLERQWLWQPPGPAEQVVKPGERGFAIQPAGATASLRGLFAHPAAVTVQTKPRKYEYIKNFGKQQGTKITVDVTCMSVSGADSFFFVATVGAGAADKHPPAQVEGKGLDAVVTVGKRTVRFDGTKVVLGTK